VRASSDPAALGPQDAVICTLKATGLSSLADGLQPLLAEDTAVVFAQNGVPWWYDIGLSPSIRRCRIWPSSIPADACVPRSRRAYRRRRGVFVQRSRRPRRSPQPFAERNRLLIGECDDRASERVARLRAALNEASIDSPEVTQIRETIWSKLLTNMSMSVLCLLTGQTARAVRDDPDLADIVPRLLDEANSIAKAVSPRSSASPRSGPAPDHKPSILQDYELGRAMEIDVLVRAPAAFARAAGLPTPMLDMMAALAIRQARTRGSIKG
jgi:2-dehydropantoate 2-reductase